MKRLFYILLGLSAFGVWFGLNFQTSAQTETKRTNDFDRASSSIVISQFQTRGDAAANIDLDEFIELHNISSSSIDLNNFSLLYRPANGTTLLTIYQWNTSTIIPAGGYHLVATNTYDGSVPANSFYTGSSVSMSVNGGGMAISNSSGTILDSLAYGTAVTTHPFTEGTKTTAPAANSSQARLNSGCQDNDTNSADFSNVNPSTPRNAATAPFVCGGGGGANLLASGGANPASVAPGATTLLTVSVTPATVPPSTNIAVSGNLTNIGLSNNQQFFDNGSNGDVTSGDNIFSYLATIPANATGGTFTVSATATDAEMRSASVTINVTIAAAPAPEDYLLLGNPSNATSDANFPNNYLMIKPQYALSYDRDRAIPNWVSWRLDSTWLGSAPRQDDFRPDNTLPAGWYQATDGDYSGSGFTRGHHTPSGDRTRSIPDNSATFLMTNMMPQSAANNNGPWNNMEIYCRTLASAGNELYIIMGGAGQGGVGTNSPNPVTTIANGRIAVPAQTWKVVLVLPNGSNDLSRINTSTRVFSVIMPNSQTINSDWTTYLTTVDAVEALTGYDFFSNIPDNVEQIIEAAPFGPTAATVSVSGRVTLPQTFGQTGALVTLTDSRGHSRTLATGKFGSFRFTDVVAGETYVLRAFSKRHNFAPQVITPMEDVTELSFAP